MNLCISDSSPSIRNIAKVIGNMVASFPAVPYGKLFYRQLEHDKIKALHKKTKAILTIHVDILNTHLLAYIGG